MANKIPPPEEIHEIIREVMKSKGVKHQLVPYEDGKFSLDSLLESKRYFKKYGFAWLQCKNCSNNWPSSRAWCAIDLKFMKIRYRFYQECQKCGDRARPIFPRETVEKLAECAVDSYMIKIGMKESKHRYGIVTRTVKGKHDEDRCEVCNLYGGPCIKQRE